MIYSETSHSNHVIVGRGEVVEAAVVIVIVSRSSPRSGRRFAAHFLTRQTIFHQHSLLVKIALHESIHSSFDTVLFLS